MKKIPKREYAFEFRELAVKRVKAGQTIVAVAKEQFTAPNLPKNGVINCRITY